MSSIDDRAMIETKFPSETMLSFNATNLLNASVNNADCNAVDSLPGRINYHHPPHCVMFDFVMEAIVMGFLAVFGCIGNCLSLMVLSREKSKSVTPFLLMALVVAETVFLATVLIVRVLTSVQSFNTSLHNPISHVLPYFGSYIYPVAMTAETGTIWLTILVTVNRFMAVCRPYDVTQLASKMKARKQVTVVVMFAIIYNIPRYFDYSVKTRLIRGHNCTVMSEIYVRKTTFSSNQIYNLIYHNIMYFLVMYIIPLAMLVVLNYKLTRALKYRKQRHRNMVAAVHDAQSRSEDDITTILVAIVLVFLICQTPALITQSLLSLLNEKSTLCPNFYFYYARCSDALVVLNSSMNFIIYIFCSQRFRKRFLQWFCNNRFSDLVTNAQTLGHISSPETAV